MCCSVHALQRPIFPTFRKQCVAVCCGVLQCAAVCCSVLEVWCGGELSCVVVFAMYILWSAGYCQHSGSCVLQSVAVCCSVLQCVAVCYSSMLPIVAESCSVHTTKCWILPIFVSAVLQCVAVCCSELQRVAACIPWSAEYCQHSGATAALEF